MGTQIQNELQLKWEKNVNDTTKRSNDTYTFQWPHDQCLYRTTVHSPTYWKDE